MPDSSLNTLLHEARTLANFAARTNTLPENSLIFDKIDELALAREHDGHASISPLIAEMAQVSRAAQVTVAQLMRRETPLGRFRHWSNSATPFLIGFITLLLTLYLAFQSSELHKADLALREYQDLVGERLQDKIYLAWKMYRYERVLVVKGPVLAQLDGYQKLVDDAKRLYVKRDAVQQMLLETAVIRYVPQIFQYYGPCWSQNLARTLNADVSIACLMVQPSVLPEYSADNKSALKMAAADCAVSHLQPEVADKTTSVDSKVDLDGYVQSISCFVQALNIAAYDEPVDRQIYATRNKVHLLVSWLLPGLYGLLGACVFVMRGLLRNTSQFMGGSETRIVDMLSLLLRVSLGGLAGIIIGWFSVPTASSAGSASIAVSSIPFGLAFLAGYGIESLFSLLDRLNKTIGQPDDSPPAKAVGTSNIAAPAAPEPKATA